MPIANDLELMLSAARRWEKQGAGTYEMNVITATLASATAPLSKPYPTATRERMPPAADNDSRFLRPKRYAIISKQL